MNAGAHQQNIGEIVDSVRMVLAGGRTLTANHDELRFAYRSSAIPRDAIITSVRLKLKLADSKEIHELIKRYNAERTSSQPLKEKSAGCIFKNPGGPSSAGKLIQDAGLKGFRIGGAAVSEKHANFIVNRDRASFEDALKLIEHIKKTVKEKQKISLHEEVIVWRSE